MAMAAASSDEEEEEEEEDEALLACLVSPCELHCSSSHCGQRNFARAFRFSKLQIGVLFEGSKKKSLFFRWCAFFRAEDTGFATGCYQRLGRSVASRPVPDMEGWLATELTRKVVALVPSPLSLFLFFLAGSFRFLFLFSSTFCVLHSLLEGDFMDFVVHSQHFHSHFPFAPASSRVGWAALLLLLLLLDLCLRETLITSETCKSARNVQFFRRVLPFSMLEGTELLGASFGLWEQRKPAPVCLPRAPFRAQSKRTSFSSAHVRNLSLNSLSLLRQFQSASGNFELSQVRDFDSASSSVCNKPPEFDAFSSSNCKQAI